MFTVTLHHLAPEAKKAGASYPDLELPDVPEKKLRQLIRALAALAAADQGGASPEMKVAAPHGQFVVQISQGRLRINSWTMRVGGTDLSPDQIFSLITGAEAVADAAAEVDLGGRKQSRFKLVLLLAVLILGSNGVTAWMMLRQPPNPLLPEYTLLTSGPAERLLAGVAGEYQTGTNPGGRALVIAANGHARWRTFGPGQKITEESEVVLQAAQSKGKPALLADGQALIAIVDPVSIVFYAETYRRKAP